MFVTLGKGTLAPPIAYWHYFREEGPPTASVDSHLFPRKYWRLVNNMGFNHGHIIEWTPDSKMAPIHSYVNCSMAQGNIKERYASASWELSCGVRIMPKPDTHAKRVLLTHNDSHTRSVWFANTKHHSQTNAFCFRNKYSMFYTYKETYFFNYKKISSKYKKKSFKYTKQFYKYGTLRVDLKAFARGSVRRKMSAKSHVTNKCWVSLRPPGRSFFLPKIFIWYRPKLNTNATEMFIRLLTIL